MPEFHPDITPPDLHNNLQGKEIIINGVPEVKLIQAAQQGPNQEAYAQIFVYHSPHVVKVVPRCPDVEVDDVMQDTYIRGWRGLPRFQDTGAGLRPWLSMIARNRGIDLIHRSQRITMETRDPLDDGVSQRIFEQHGVVPSAESTVLGNLAAKDIVELVGQVAPNLDAHRLMWAIHVTGSLLKEYAADIGISPNTAGSRARRIRAQIQKNNIRGVLEQAGIL